MFDPVAGIRGDKLTVSGTCKLLDGVSSATTDVLTISAPAFAPNVMANFPVGVDTIRSLIRGEDMIASFSVEQNRSIYTKISSAFCQLDDQVPRKSKRLSSICLILCHKNKVSALISTGMLCNFQSFDQVTTVSARI